MMENTFLFCWVFFGNYLKSIYIESQIIYKYHVKSFQFKYSWTIETKKCKIHPNKVRLEIKLNNSMFYLPWKQLGAFY